MSGKLSAKERLTLLENMGYEIEMLLGPQILWSKQCEIVAEEIDPVLATGWMRNALLEAQVVHVRTLLEFFFLQKDKEKAKAGDYVLGWRRDHAQVAEKWLGENAGRLYGDINLRLSHLSAPRNDKRVWDTLPKITDGLLRTVRLFESLLGSEESSALRSRMPDIGWNDPARVSSGE